MKRKPLHLRTLITSIAETPLSSTPIPRIHHNKPISSSSSSSLKPHFTKPFFKPNNDVHHLCEDKRFKEAIDILCQQKRLKEAVQILDLIDQSKIIPSAPIYSSLLQLCLELRNVESAERIHSHIQTSGFVPGTFISNRLLDIYAKCGSVGSARKVFDEMRERDACSWNTMISGYTKTGKLEEAFGLFEKMPDKDNFTWSTMISGYVRHDQPKEGLVLFRIMQGNGDLKSNKFTVSSGLAAASALPCLRIGKEIHGHIVRSGLDSDKVVWSALSDMYGKCGSIEEARHVFDKMVDRDVVCWTAMIARYFDEGRRKEGYTLFLDMLKSGTKPNDYTFAAVLNACSNQASEDTGRQVHGHMVRVAPDPFSFAASALVHMYSKCGNMEVATRVFEGMPNPDLVSWTSLIAGYAQNGQPEKALRYFELQLESELMGISSLRKELPKLYLK